MKKARIVLSALGILAAVGGALAFKANKAYTGALKCKNTTAPTTECTVVTYTVTTNAPLQRCTNIGAAPGTPCELLRVVIKQ